MLNCQPMEFKNIKLSPVDTEARKKVDVRPGDTVRVMQKIKEGEKTRLQAFEGIILAIKHGKEIGGTFTVRKVVDSVGVERIFPLFSPSIDSIDVLKRAKVRRAKLYYIREKATKELKRHMKNEIIQVRKESSDVAPKKEKIAEVEKVTE